MERIRSGIGLLSQAWRRLSSAWPLHPGLRQPATAVVQRRYPAPWGADRWRLDAAVGWRSTGHTQVKLQFSIQHENAAEHDFGHLFATQVTGRF